MVERVVWVRGVFDAGAARALPSRLARIREGATVVVDFSGVSDYDDLALAVLAQRLSREAHDRVVLRGLRYRQERILRHFGIERIEPAPAGFPPPGR
jgi:anti-anti-sigma regulatory factor